MSSPRLKALAKLLFLLGLPLALLFALFAGGVYVGVSHRPAILAFEKDWLGMDVVVPPAAESPTTAGWIRELAPLQKFGQKFGTGTGTAIKPEPDTTPEPADDGDKKPAPDTKPDVDAKPDVDVNDDKKPTPDTKPDVDAKPDTEPPPRSLLDPTPRPPMPVTMALPEPLSGELQALRREPQTLRLEVEVDATFAELAADPFSYVQHTVAWASQIYETQVGLRLDLRAITLGDPGAGDPAAKLASLCATPVAPGTLRLAFVATPVDDRSWIADDGRCALISKSPKSRLAPHLRSLLHTLGELLGATPLRDPTAAAWRSGSWMGEILAEDTQPLWIDPASREAMLRGKQRLATTRPE